MKYSSVLMIVLSLLVVLAADLCADQITVSGDRFFGRRYSTDGGTTYNDVGNGESLITLMDGCTPAIEEMHRYRSRRSLSSGVGIVAAVVIGIPIVALVASGEPWGDTQTTLVAAGAGIALFSVGLRASAFTHLDNAVRLYNRSQPDVELGLGIVAPDRTRATGLFVSLKF